MRDIRSWRPGAIPGPTSSAWHHEHIDECDDFLAKAAEALSDMTCLPCVSEGPSVQAAPAPSVPTPKRFDFSYLAELVQFRREGFLTEAEFAKAKADLGLNASLHVFGSVRGLSQSACDQPSCIAILAQGA